MKDDTLKLQVLLEKCGDVYFPSGTYTISDTLVIHDNTKLTLAQDTVIRLADHACCFMLKNDKCGKDGSNYNITVEGGIWDGNNMAQERGKVYADKPYFFGIVMRFEGVFDLTVRSLTIKDPESYVMQLRFVDRFTVENITFDYNMKKTNMDGVHVNGPSRNGIIKNIKGATNDDLVALNCDDGYDNGEKAIKTKGDIENIQVDGLFADNGYTAVRLLSCGSTLKNVSIKNIFGTYRFYGVSFTHHNVFPGEPSWFDGIFIENVFCSKASRNHESYSAYCKAVDKAYGEGITDRAVKNAPVIWFEGGVNCGNIVVSNINRIETEDTEAPMIQIDENAKIDNFRIVNAYQNFVNCEDVPLIVNKGIANITD